MAMAVDSVQTINNWFREGVEIISLGMGSRHDVKVTNTKLWKKASPTIITGERRPVFII
jgi:hypothetical protein